MGKVGPSLGTSFILDCISLVQSKIAPDLYSGSVVKNPPAIQGRQKMWVRSLGREDPLKKGMATPSSILAWRIPWTEEPGGLQSIGSPRVRRD